MKTEINVRWELPGSIWSCILYVEEHTTIAEIKETISKKIGEYGNKIKNLTITIN